MMTIQQQEQFDLLLKFCRDPKLHNIARENLAEAKGFLNGVFSTGTLGAGDFRAYHSQIMAMQVRIHAYELNSVRELPKTYNSFSDGVRATVERQQ